LTDTPNRSELETLIEGAVARALAAALPPLEQRLVERMDRLDARMAGVMTGAQQLFAALHEQMARVEDRLAALEIVVGQTNARLTAIEVDLAEIKGRLGRMSADITRARTTEIERHAALERRVEALEAAAKARHP
jgi:septal ring factor EnvC (AmiA/AmiB activator)